MIVGIVLAGGASSRMGRTKALLPIGGTTFVARIVGTLRAAGCAQVVVVTGAAHDEVAAELARHAPDARTVRNPAPERGQLSSLQVALADIGDARVVSVADDERVEAAVVALCDHPLVRVETVTSLVDAWRESGADIVRPASGGRHGHPVVFAHRVFDRLRAADPDAGARAVVRATDLVRLDVEVDDPGVFVDVDTPEEYEALDG